MINDANIQDLYELVDKKFDKLERLIREQEDRFNTRMEKLEDRVSKNEGIIAKALGAFSVISLFLGSVVAWLWNRIIS